MAGTIAEIRSYEFLFICMFSSVSYILVVVKKQKMVLVYTIITLLFNNLVVFIGGRVWANDIVTVLILSIGSAILNLLFLLYAFSQTDFGVKKYLKLVLFVSVSFLIIAITGNFILKEFLK